MPDSTQPPVEPRRVEDLFNELRSAGHSTEEIFTMVYVDLKQLARKLVSGEQASPSMHATRLLSDLWIRLFGRSTSEFTWESGAHFFHTMARAMRQLLIDHARKRRAQSRGSGKVQSLDELLGAGQEATDQLSRQGRWFDAKAEQTFLLAQALEDLERNNHRSAVIFDLKVFSPDPLTTEQIAQMLHVSALRANITETLFVP